MLKTLAVAMMSGLLLLSACTNYGDSVEFGEGKVYYKDGASKEQAEKVGEFLKRTGYFDDTTRKDVQLVKEGETLILRFVVQQDQLTAEVRGAFRTLTSAMRTEVFGGAAAEFQFCDESMDLIEKVN